MVSYDYRYEGAIISKDLNPVVYRVVFIEKGLLPIPSRENLERKIEERGDELEVIAIYEKVNLQACDLIRDALLKANSGENVNFEELLD